MPDETKREVFAIGEVSGNGRRPMAKINTGRRQKFAVRHRLHFTIADGKKKSIADAKMCRNRLAYRL